MYLAGEDDEEGDEEGDLHGIEDTEGGDYVDGKDGAGTGVGEDGDEHVLLHVERPRVEGELVAPAGEEGSRGEERRHETAEGQHGDLRRHGRDLQRLLAVPEEGVDEGERDAGGRAEHPCPEGEDRRQWVVAHGHRQRHLLHRRVLQVRRR